jgi:hypothetical protein
MATASARIPSPSRALGMTCVRGLAANAVGHGSGDLSVVIPAYNEERRIGRRLERVVAFLGEQRWKRRSWSSSTAPGTARPRSSDVS